ncbi:MAG: hypothetical protein AAF596_09820, partial [Planctomycetota bacterium]
LIVESDTVTLSRFDLTVHGFADTRDLGLRPEDEGPPRLPPIEDGTPLRDLLATDPTGLTSTIATGQVNPVPDFGVAQPGLFGFAADGFSTSNFGSTEIFTSFILAAADSLDGYFAIEPVTLFTTQEEFEIDARIPGGGVETLTVIQTSKTLAASFVLVPEPAALLLAAISVPWLVGPRTRR